MRYDYIYSAFKYNRIKPLAFGAYYVLDDISWNYIRNSYSWFHWKFASLLRMNFVSAIVAFAVRVNACSIWHGCEWHHSVVRDRIQVLEIGIALSGLIQLTLLRAQQSAALNKAAHLNSCERSRTLEPSFRWSSKSSHNIWLCVFGCFRWDMFAGIFYVSQELRTWNDVQRYCINRVGFLFREVSMRISLASLRSLDQWNAA